jgi:hypothetical protein
MTVPTLRVPARPLAGRGARGARPSHLLLADRKTDMTTTTAPAWLDLAQTDFPAPTVVTVLGITTVLERRHNSEVLHLPSTVVTALLHSASGPETVVLLRADLLDEDEDDLYGHRPSIWWHRLPRHLLEAAIQPDAVAIHDPGVDTAVVCLAPQPAAEGWIVITEQQQLALGYPGLLLPEAHSDIHVPVEQLSKFLEAAR